MKRKNVGQVVSDAVNFVKTTSFVIANIKWIVIIGGILVALFLLVLMMIGLYTTVQTQLAIAAAAKANLDPTSQIRFADTTGDTLALQDVALSFLGVPYVFGAASTSGADCSGFILQVYSMAGTGVILPHSANDMANNGEIIFEESYKGETMDKVAQTASTDGWFSAAVKPDPGDITIFFTSDEGTTTTLLPGDLLFFNYGRATKVGSRIGHVAMYIGNGQIVHTSNATEDCCIKSLYTVSDDGTITWTSYAKSCIKITRMLDPDGYVVYSSDLTGSPMADITAADAYNLGIYLDVGMDGKPDRVKYNKAIEIINAARSARTSISTELSKTYAIPTERPPLSVETKRLVRMCIIGKYWKIVSSPSPTPVS